MKDQRQFSERFLYVIWNAWKERNRHIFTGRLAYIEVASIAREDIIQQDRAFIAFAPTIPAELD
jgi:hypothetical protein